jgi:penicillin-binding protein 1A
MNNKQKKILKITGLVCLVPALIFFVVLIRALSLLESKEKILNYNNATASVVLSDDGSLIGKIFTENRTNVNYKQIPDHLIHALVATEDVRFFKHHGIDTRSLFRVFFKTILLSRESSGGGSTITQQLAKNMFGRTNKGPFPLLVNKLKESILARRIEKLFTKEQILTLYLNTVPFGENVYGIEAAALRYFNKSTSDLKIEESAVLVGMLKANNLYNPRLNPKKALERRNLVLRMMVENNYLKQKKADYLTTLPLKLNYSNIELKGPADYFIYQLRNQAEKILDDLHDDEKKWNLEEDGLILNTTLNLDLQKKANKAFYDHLSVMQKRINEQYKKGSGKKYLDYWVKKELNSANYSGDEKEVGLRTVFDWNGNRTDSISAIDSVRMNLRLLHAGLLAIEPHTGSIKVWVGGIDFKTQPFDQVLARRQMGSTLKPFIYATAFENGISPCEYLNNDSVVVEGYDDWHPANFDNTFGGKYSLTGALVHSMNIPTLNLFLETGFESLDSLWKKLGFSFELDNTPSLAMGTSEASVLEVAVAYSAFANGGIKVDPQMLLSITKPDGTIIWKVEKKKFNKRVLSERACTMINYILQKAISEGTGSPLRYNYNVTIPLAGKTGTSQDYTDAWFAAYNPSIVIVSRVGGSIPAIHFNSGSLGTGSALALPLVALTLKDPVPGEYISGFQEPDIEMQMEFDCPDYREKEVIDNIREFFKRNRIYYDSTDTREIRKRPSFFKRIFGKRE